MWVHKERRIGFIAHPRTGSREIGYEILAKRGFVRFLGHHGVPWGGQYPRTPKNEPSGEQWWWFNESLLDWRFYAAHRNHFEVFHSIAHVIGLRQPLTPQRLATYIWGHHAVYRSQHVLFPAFFEVAGCRPLRFDHLRRDVDVMLLECGVEPLRHCEGRRDKSIHHTAPKPRDEHYSAILGPEVRAWIERTYATEMARFGYSWAERSAAPEPVGSGGRDDGAWIAP